MQFFNNQTASTKATPSSSVHYPTPVFTASATMDEFATMVNDEKDAKEVRDTLGNGWGCPSSDLFDHFNSAINNACMLQTQRPDWTGPLNTTSRPG
jgi:hypothetical protein